MVETAVFLLFAAAEMLFLVWMIVVVRRQHRGMVAARQGRSVRSRRAGPRPS